MLDGMSQRWVSPVGTAVTTDQRRRSAESARYRREAERIAPYEEFARAIIRLRMDHRLTQAELAERVKTTGSAIARLESGRHRPNVDTLQKIARAYGGRLVVGFELPASGRVRRTRELIAL